MFLHTAPAALTLLYQSGEHGHDCSNWECSKPFICDRTVLLKFSLVWVNLYELDFKLEDESVPKAPDVCFKIPINFTRLPEYLLHNPETP